MGNLPLQEMGVDEGLFGDFGLDDHAPIGSSVTERFEDLTPATDDQADDEWLVRYVSATVGRHVTDPGSVVVRAYDGRVTLRGVVAAGEILGLIRAVSSLPDVHGLNNQLEIDFN